MESVFHNQSVLHKQTVLVVDDVPENIELVDGILTPTYRIKAALNGRSALRIAHSDDPPDIILLDIMMPDMDGYEVCRRLKANADTEKIPVIFVTARGEISDEARGFQVGAVDYITKPISPPIVRARIQTHLALYDQNRALEEKVHERTQELAHTQDITIHSLAVLAETRDNETGGHIMRTQRYVRALAEALVDIPAYRMSLDSESITLMFKSAPLHDIGKVGVQDSILLKPGKLTNEEFAEMKNHAVYGHTAIIRAEEAFGDRNGTSFLRFAREITHTHHEKWDGSGYPQSLSGDDIPLSGRLMAVADVYDALISRRVYKPPFPHAKAVAIILEGKGAHFDPAIVDTFETFSETFRKIALQFAENDEERAVLAE